MNVFTFLRVCFFLVCFLLVSELRVNGQVKEDNQINVPDSIGLFTNPLLLPPDSLLKRARGKYKDLFSKFSGEIITAPVKELKLSLSDSLTHSIKNQLSPGRPLIEIKNGYINYNYGYRSNFVPLYFEKNIQQHTANLSANVLLAQKFPFRVSVSSRNTNSAYFRNYTDVRVEFNAREYRRLQAARLAKEFTALTDQLQNQTLKSRLDNCQKSLAKAKSFISRPDIIKKYLVSKETLINRDQIPGLPKYKDSIIKDASALIALYEKGQMNIRNLEKAHDSLQKEYVSLTHQIGQLHQIFKSNISSPGGTKIIKSSLNKAGLHDKRFERLLTSLYAVRKLEIGRTFPNYTNLTVQNISVNGANVEINGTNLYLAFIGGLIDFRFRDFVTNKNKNRQSGQYVTAARIGWGQKEGNHVILTGYQGRKHIFSSQAAHSSIPIFGLSLESQFVINRNIRFIAEVAQSSITSTKGFLNDSPGKAFSLSDNNSQAFSLQAFSYFPKTRTRLDGKYEFQGIHFQCFNAYKPNASTNAWHIRADQYLFSGALHLAAAIHKNDYVNPIINQNYSSNTIFTTISATFRKRFWPVISVGYIPSSQYSIIHDQVYESRYQAFTATMNHTYKLGLVNATSSAMYNRFYNDSRDSGFVYYNAHNLTLNQNIIFERFSANIGISHTQNSRYSLDVMNAGINKTILKNNSIGLGVKLNHINSQENKFGYYINTSINIRKVGVLNVWGERGYYPGIGNGLIKNEFFNIGFTRYFN